MEGDELTEQAVIQRYQQMYSEYSSIANKIAEIEWDKREHKTVVDAISQLDGNRKCWRLVGGVLVERTVSEVLPAVQKNCQMIEDALKKLTEQFTSKETELQAFKNKYKIRVRGETEQPKKMEDRETKTQGGVL